MSWKENKKQKRKRLRDEARQNNWCVDCYVEDKTKTPAYQTYRKCEAHLKKTRDRETVRRLKFKEEGMCRNHRWGIPVKSGFDQCEECLDATNSNARKRHIEAIANNMCVRHPDRPAVPGLHQCEDCITRSRVYSKDRRETAKANGKCTRHITIDAITADSCLECWYKDVARNNLDDINAWQDIKALMEAQNFECIYTKTKLIPGDNASMDHIIPRSRGGTNTLDNVQWVTKEINSMKNDHTHEEFVEICRLVVANGSKMS